MLTIATMRELLGAVDHLGDAALQMVHDAELAYVEEQRPDAVDGVARDMVIIDLMKLRLAYNGVSSISTPGYTAAWQQSRVQLLMPLGRGKPL